MTRTRGGNDIGALAGSGREIKIGTGTGIIGIRIARAGIKTVVEVGSEKTRSTLFVSCVLSSSQWCVDAVWLFCRRRKDNSEERRERKAEKKRLRAEEEARQVAELSVYSATDNPFHDVNLGQQFHWQKKAEKERKAGLSLSEAQRKDAIRRQDAKDELERLNRRRKEREEEMKLREEEELRMQRLQESAKMSEWLDKDGDFQLEQEHRRAAIRIKEKRAKAIDFLALNLKYVNPPKDDEEEEEEDLGDAGLEIDLDEPYKIFDVSGLLRLLVQLY